MQSRYVYKCDDCGDDIDPTKPDAVQYIVTVTRSTPQELGPDEDGHTSWCMLPQPTGPHPSHKAKTATSLCPRCIGADVLRRFAPPEVHPRVTAARAKAAAESDNLVDAKR